MLKPSDDWPEVEENFLRSVFYKGETVKLTLTEGVLLQALLAAQGKGLRLSKMIELAWPNPHYQPECSVLGVKVRVSTLRKKLKPWNFSIVTLRGSHNYPGSTVYRLIQLVEGQTVERGVLKEAPGS